MPKTGWLFSETSRCQLPWPLPRPQRLPMALCLWQPHCRGHTLLHCPLCPGEGDFCSLRKRWLGVGTGAQTASLATHLSGDGTTELADEGELVLLRVALHDRAAGPHLRHDASSTPQVNGGAVVPLPWEEERPRGAL